MEAVRPADSCSVREVNLKTSVTETDLESLQRGRRGGGSACSLEASQSKKVRRGDDKR